MFSFILMPTQNYLVQLLHFAVACLNKNATVENNGDCLLLWLIMTETQDTAAGVHTDTVSVWCLSQIDFSALLVRQRHIR